ncbi:MAG: response regulator transcription factor [Chloroflexota bacterium]|nr:response regulator transcription factor [Chloroflexota bacterium]
MQVRERLIGSSATAERPAAPPLSPRVQPSPAADSGPRTQILVVEDERALRETLAYNLRKAGFEVRLVEDGTGALATARAQPPDLILLDVLLPGGIDGFEVCRLLRHDLRCPIILVSALAEEVDRVVGLEVGADDYVTKPFSIVELLARIKAHLRRAGMPAAGPLDRRQHPQAVSPLIVGDLEVDASRREVRVNGRTVQLKRREFDLLHYLARHAGMTLTRSRLLDAVWSDQLPGRGDTRTVDVHIHRLRERIEPKPSSPRYLHTVRGLGYALRPVNVPLKSA